MRRPVAYPIEVGRSSISVRAGSRVVGVDFEDRSEDQLVAIVDVADALNPSAMYVERFLVVVADDQPAPIGVQYVDFVRSGSRRFHLYELFPPESCRL